MKAVIYRYNAHHMLIAMLLVVSLYYRASAATARIVAVGDSFTDAGNWLAASDGTFPPPPYWEGRFSNGPVWVDYLADFLQIPRPIASRLGGTNAAFGGATTGEGGFVDTRGNPPSDSAGKPIETPRLGMQIEAILANHTLSESDLVVVWAGFNDLDTALPGGAVSPDQIVANLSEHILTLQQAGARDFLLANLHNGSAAHSTFNSLWQSKVRDLSETLPANFFFLDFGALASDVISRRADFGFNNDTSPIVDRAVANPDEYTNWDGIHITTAFHRIVADGALDALRHVDGDLNDNGVVEQGDLDLVLLNWGRVGRPVPPGWVNNLPYRLIDQEELDRVLMNWGHASPVPRTPATGAATPEPSSVSLLAAIVAALLSMHPKWKFNTPSARSTRP